MDLIKHQSGWDSLLKQSLKKNFIKFQMLLIECNKQNFRQEVLSPSNWSSRQKVSSILQRSYRFSKTFTVIKIVKWGNILL